LKVTSIQRRPTFSETVWAAAFSGFTERRAAIAVPSAAHAKAEESIP
jgi:hypothetical protein